MRDRFQLVRLISVAGALVATTTLAGWIFDIPLFTTVLPGYAAMKPITAICFILTAISLWILSGPASSAFLGPLAKNAARGSALLVVLVALLSLIEIGLNVRLGLDDLFFSKALAVTQTTTPGRMSLATAVNFLLIGLALCLIDFELPRGRRPSEYLALLTVLISCVATAGYIYTAHGLSQSIIFSTMALHTAILFMLLGTGVLFARPDRGLTSVITSPNAGGWMARRILPITTCMPFAIGWLRTHGEQAGLYQHELGLAIFATTNITILAIIIWINARSLNRIDAQRRRTEEEIQHTAVQLNQTNLLLQAEIAKRTEAQESLRLANENLELKVQERTAKLEEANRELEAFSYSVSHDLRAPLRAINGFGKMLVETGRDKLNEEERGFLDRVCANSDRMGLLIDDLLNLSRLSRSAMRRSTVNLSELATAIIHDLRTADPARQVETVIQPGLKVEGDENLLRIMLENLLGNAWKFTSKLASARIEFGSRLEDDGTLYFVSDNGAGFEMTYVERLFGAFQRLHGQNEFEGTGIGLATVQRILHRHEGTIKAHGEVDRGATFTFTIGS